MGKIKKIAILIFISMALSACGDKYDNRQNTALASAETEEKEYLDGYEWHYEVAVKKEKTPTEIYCQNLMGKEFRESITPASQNEIVTGIPIFEEQKLTVPKTYSELLSVCETLQKAGYASPILAYNGNSSYMLLPLFYPYFCAQIQGNEKALKDRAGSAGTGDRRLLPQMRRDPGNPHLLPQTAESGAHRTVGAALPGTQCTDHEQPSDLRRLIIEPERRKIKPVEITGIFRYNIRVKKSTLNAKETKRFG